MTEKEAVLKRIREFPYPVSNEELDTDGVSKNAQASRLSDLSAAKLIQGRIRKGYRFKEWWPIERPPLDWTPPGIVYGADGQGEMFRGAA